MLNRSVRMFVLCKLYIAMLSQINTKSEVAEPKGPGTGQRAGPGSQAADTRYAKDTVSLTV
jgi:hypothetical protein